MDQGLQATRISAGGTYTACPDVKGESPYRADCMGKVKKRVDLKDRFEKFQKYKRMGDGRKGSIEKEKEEIDPWNENKEKRIIHG